MKKPKIGCRIYGKKSLGVGGDLIGTTITVICASALLVAALRMVLATQF